MHRFFISADEIKEGTALISGEDVNHISRVLRLGEGEEICLCDGLGYEYKARITEIEKSRIRASILEKTESLSEPSCRMTLYQGVPKGDKMELIIQKCVELGVHRIVPVLSERSIVKMGELKDRERKRQRWERISYEAAKQSRRGLIPSVEIPRSLDEVLPSMAAHQLFVVPWEEEKDQGIKCVLEKKEPILDAAFLIGPEGGLTADEIKKAMQVKGIPVTLGHRILRTETAGMAVLTMILYHMNEFGGK